MPPSYQPIETIEGAMQTPDGAWRIDAVRAGGNLFYRVIHGESVVSHLSISSVELILDTAGVDRAELVSVDPAA